MQWLDDTDLRLIQCFPTQYRANLPVLLHPPCKVRLAERSPLLFRFEQKVGQNDHGAICESQPWQIAPCSSRDDPAKTSTDGVSLTAIQIVDTLVKQSLVLAGTLLGRIGLELVTGCQLTANLFPLQRVVQRVVERRTYSYTAFRKFCTPSI